MPEQRRITGALGRFLPAIVLIVGIIISVIASEIIATHEYVEINWATQLAAEAIRSDLREDIEWQRVGLDRLALLWEAAESKERIWISNAELYIQHRPGCIAVEWLGSDESKPALVVSGRAIAKLAFQGRPQTALDAARKSGNAVYSDAAVGDHGIVEYAIAYPVYTDDQFRGFVVAFFDFARTIDENLGDVRGLGFSFSVIVPGEAEYVMPGTNRQNESNWAQTVDVPFAGVTWQLRTWPNPDTLYRIRSALPQISLILGIVISVLAFLTLYFGVGIVSSSAQIRVSNEALQREIAVREGTERELRRAHSELDVRVHERTAELGAANVLLENEVAEHERAEELLRELTGRLFHLQDEDRRQLARELHDGAVQNLVALSMDMGMIRDAVASGDVTTRELVNDCILLIEQATKELRTISYLLHPPYFDELGLRTALSDFVEGFASRSGIQISLDIDPRLGRLGHETELTLYRVVQETLSNVHRHSHSRTATVSLQCEAGFARLAVADAGRGMPSTDSDPSRPSVTGVGIAGMRERVRLLGGRLEVHSSSAGTTVQALLPVGEVCFHKKLGVETHDEIRSSSPLGKA